MRTEENTRELVTELLLLINSIIASTPVDVGVLHRISALRHRASFLGLIGKEPEHLCNDCAVFIRASGDVACKCGRRYCEHPSETRVVDWEGRPFLRRLCDGTLVKL